MAGRLLFSLYRIQLQHIADELQQEGQVWSDAIQLQHIDDELQGLM
jgi:hypothetical protein